MGHPPYGPGYHVTVEGRFRERDDSSGVLTALVKERAFIGSIGER
jgi:hypothetical protein